MGEDALWREKGEDDDPRHHPRHAGPGTHTVVVRGRAAQLDGRRRCSAGRGRRTRTRKRTAFDNACEAQVNGPLQWSLAGMQHVVSLSFASHLLCARGASAFTASRCRSRDVDTSCHRPSVLPPCRVWAIRWRRRRVDAHGGRAVRTHRGRTSVAGRRYIVSTCVTARVEGCVMREYGFACSS